MKTLEKHVVKEKRVLLRVDLNVPVINNVITDTSRIEAIKPTLKKLIDQKNKIFILSHFGRPKGTRNKKYSLKFICATLEKEFQIDKIHFLDNFEDENVKNIIIKMKPKEICLFENIRFYPQEEKNEKNFIVRLIKNFDVYVNDAFSVSHRNHASIVSVPQYLPSYAGYNLIKEISSINFFLSNSKKPNLAIIGGSKISTKIDILLNLLKLFDSIVIGGAMANTFLKAQNINIGTSLNEERLLSTAVDILEKAKKNNCKIILPIDVFCAKDINNYNNISYCEINNVPSKQMILDVGNKTVELISKEIMKSKMVLWNGPLGAFEYQPFEKSSVEIANTIKIRSKLKKLSSLVGGGDTVSLIKQAKADDGFTYISNAGGAFLEWLEGKELPGIVALRKNKIY